MSHLAYRWLSWVFARWPASPDRKEQIKAFLYRNLGRLFRASPNYGEWLRANPTRHATALAASPVEPTAAAWAALGEGVEETIPRSFDSPEASPPSPVRKGRPYIVVPVYRGRAETLACLYSVRLSTPDARLIVIDDGCPDARLAADLHRLAAAGHFELMHNETNQGFLRTANRGLALHPEADVVLLNSDTEVYGDWLTRLNAAAYREHDIGTVTPLSNNGDIASYPHAQQDNRARLELGFSDIDALASEVNADSSVETPTGVGHCLYIRRACLDDTGVFDELFVAGYGEENDFCLRAREKGWRNLIAGDVYIRHTGAVSFGQRASRLRRDAWELLVSRHPTFPKQVDEFWRQNPLQLDRLRLDAARMRRNHPVRSPIRSLLFVTHDWGGGVEEHVRELTKRLGTEQVAVYTLRGKRVGESLGLRLEGSPIAPALDHVPATDSMMPEDLAGLVDALRILAIDHLHLHHAGEFSETGAAWLTTLCSELDVSYDVTLHDYAPICPRLHLEGPLGRYCGEPDLPGCQRCLDMNGSRFGVPDLKAWHRDWRLLLVGARRVFCPTEDLYRRIATRWPEPSYVVRGHPESPVTFVPPGLKADFSKKRPHTRLRVLVPGAINEQKGLGLLIDCAEDARARSLPLEFWIVGYSRDDARAKRAGILLGGRHAPGTTDAEIARLLRSPSVAFLPSLSPETWSYALSSVLRAGVHPVVFDLGALAERVRDTGRGTLLPFALTDHPAEVNDALLGLRDGAARTLEPLDAIPDTRYDDLLFDYYQISDIRSPGGRSSVMRSTDACS